MTALATALPLIPLLAAPIPEAPAQESAPTEVRHTDDIPDRVFRLTAEVGYLAVIDHRIQIGQNGTMFDYRESGGQDILFPVSRLSTDLFLKGRHGITLLYQPLTLESEETLAEDLVVDDVTVVGDSVHVALDRWDERVGAIGTTVVNTSGVGTLTLKSN